MNRKGSENIRIVKDFYHALSNGDSVHARSLLTPEIEWTEPASEAFPFGGRHYGVEAVFKEVIDVIHDGIRDFEIKPKKLFAVGDMVIVLGHSTGRGRVTDIKLDAATAHLWTLAEGKPVKFQAFHDLLDWQVALGRTSVQSERLAA
jgi:ketosteroid isomerase-like protein